MPHFGRRPIGSLRCGRLRPPTYLPTECPVLLLIFVPKRGTRETLLHGLFVRLICLMPQDQRFLRGVGQVAGSTCTSSGPKLQHDRLHRHIHRHGWRSRDVERHVPELTSPRRYVLTAPLFSLEPRADAQPHLFTASRPIHSPTQRRIAPGKLSGQGIGRSGTLLRRRDRPPDR